MRSGKTLKLANCISQLTAAVVYKYVSTEKCAPSALLSISRPEPAPADCTLATERRVAHRPRVGRKATSYTAVSPPNSSIVLLLLLLAVVENILNLIETMSFFDLI